MAALSADRELSMKSQGKVRAYGVKANTTIYKGSLVSIDSNGAALPSADTASTVFVGIATEQADNSAGAVNAISVNVYTEGCFKLPCTSLEQADVGRLMYVGDSATVDDKSVPTNDIPVGSLVYYNSATEGWVEIGKGVAGVASS